MWGIELHRDSEVGLARQIYLSLRERILTGQLPQGEALPSTRELARGLGVSRNTVCGAYDMLWTEGFIVSHQGAPSRVADGLQLETVRRDAAAQPTEKAEPVIRWDFGTGRPDLSLFPWQVWDRMIGNAAGGLSARQLGYSGPKGHAPLCEEITQWLFRSRSMAVDPGDVFITSGATQALHLLVDVLHKESRVFALESPSHPGMRTIIADKGHPMHWMPVDTQGADIASLESKQISAVYVTPSHQFPLGGVLPASRRAALIRLAMDRDFYVIEDDYDSEFRYTGSPISPIYSMDASHVIYVGTFSKTLFPALRLGFAVLPRPLQRRWRHCRQYMDVQNPILEQAALAEFLRKRHLDKHVRRMRRAYGEKRHVLLQCLEAAFGDSVRPWGDASGLHVALQFPGRQFGEAFALRCRDAGLRIAPVSRYCPSHNCHEDKILVGYGHLGPQQIREGIAALRRLIAGEEA